jgi:CDP-glucose 4,6-dehydratase
MESLKVFKGKKVLITGHTGFKGGWLSLWLNYLGADVAGYALDPKYPDGIFTLSGISKDIRDYRGDVRDLKYLKKVFGEVQPEVVFHLAAQPLVLESYKNPVETFDVNIMGTVNVLEAIRNTSSVKAGVMITTDKCYENREWIWGYREDEPMGGHDPYSASKGAAELVISSWRRSFFSKNEAPLIASARAGNVIGGGDWCENRLVPDIIRALLSNSPIELRNPDATRPWQHVLEPLSGYLKLGALLVEGNTRYAEGWNFGPYVHEVHSVRKVVETMLKMAGKGTWIDRSEGVKQHEANLLILDITKAIQKLKWMPTLSFGENIRLTLEWYMNYKSQDVRALSLQQIKYFESKWKSPGGQ